MISGTNWPGGDRDVAERAERRRARAQAEPGRVEQEARRRSIRDRARVGARERGRLHLLLERKKEADLLMVRPGERLQPDQVRRGRGERYPPERRDAYRQRSRSA